MRTPGPSGFWCRFCGAYQSTRTRAQCKAARMHVAACHQASDDGMTPPEVSR